MVLKNTNLFRPKEGNKGEYETKHTFKENGAYKVKVHVRKGELHEHKEETIEVK